MWACGELERNDGCAGLHWWWYTHKDSLSRSSALNHEAILQEVPSLSGKKRIKRYRNCDLAFSINPSQWQKRDSLVFPSSKSSTKYTF